MQTGARTKAELTAVSIALGGMAIIGLAVPGSLIGELAPACWVVILFGLAVRAHLMRTPGLGGHPGDLAGQPVPVRVVQINAGGRGTRSIQ